MPALDSWRRTTAALLATLALLEICWELWLAPLKPGGSWLALKALPLVALWPSVARSRIRALQWALLLLPWFFAEGVVRAFSETGRQALCAATAAALSLATMASGLAYVRLAKLSLKWRRAGASE
ncbi:MAG: DUF2069 domain-containing protein [Pseudomonadota bacterium]|nr:DUF2069 domain-containing protein [Pseudomonadota bacterium]